MQAGHQAETGGSAVAATTDALVSVMHIAVQYRNGALGISDVSYQVGPGEVVGILGANGAGKTTSVRALAGFARGEGARIVSGTISLAGEDVRNAEPHEMSARGLSFVPDRNKVFPNLTVLDNLRATGSKVPRSRRAELYEHVFQMFPVLRQRRSQPAGQLSGGQRQMLAIARCLVVAPRVLIVDEMTLGLHATVRGALGEAVREIASSGTSVVLVDESVGFALDVADHCYLLRQGELYASGRPDQFRGSELLLAGYLTENVQTNER
jgi:branched-chain amino acid transport system ATP-binding protein